jgi:hypothetical protein
VDRLVYRRRTGPTSIEPLSARRGASIDTCARRLLDSERPVISVLPSLLLALAPGELPLTLPPGPAARAWNSTESASPAKLDATVAALARGETWNDPAAWEAWAADLLAERAEPGADPDRGARLALAALGQGRSEAAWDHFAALSGRGAWLAALAPALVLGVEPGSPAVLPDGARIAPALPPLDRPTSERVLGWGRLERRGTTLSELRIGDAVVELRVAVEYDSLQIDVKHVSGGAASATFVLPEMLDFERTFTYVDWERTQPGAPLAVAISAETPEIVISCRFQPFRIGWPMTLPDALDERVLRHGFDVSVPSGDPLEPRVRGFAAALARVTGHPARVRTSGGTPAEPALSVGFEPAQEHRDAKLRSLTQALEHYALRRAP